MTSNQSTSVGTTYIHAIVALSTFSFAVLFSSLALYLTNQLGFQPNLANSIVGLFLALNFALHLFAGYLGGRLLNYKTLLAIALVFETAGMSILSCSITDYLYLGLSFFLIGCGVNSTCLNCLLTQKFQPDDTRRETTFFINYSAMNLGFILGFIISGYFAIQSNYSSLFRLSSFVSLLSFTSMVIGWKHLEDTSQKGLITSHKPKALAAVLILALLILLMLLSFQYLAIANYIVLVSGLIALCGLLCFASLTKNSDEKNKIVAFILLTIASIIFWMLFFVGPMGIIYFLKNNTNTIVLGYKISPQWFMNLNSIFVIIGSPVAATFFRKMQSRGIMPSIPKQFSIALLFITISFYVLSLGIHSASDLGVTGAIWIILHFLLQSIGEILIAPVGFAMIGKLAPKNLQGIMMGFWMMVSGIAATLSHYFSNQMTPIESTNPLLSNPHYLKIFNLLAIYGFLAATFLFLASNFIQRLLTNEQEKEDDSPLLIKTTSA